MAITVQNIRDNARIVGEINMSIKNYNMVSAIYRNIEVASYTEQRKQLTLLVAWKDLKGGGEFARNTRQGRALQVVGTEASFPRE